MDAQLYDDLLQYKLKGTYKSGITKAEKAVIRRRCTKYNVKGGELYYRKGPGIELKVVCGAEMANTIFIYFHASSSGAHIGQKRTRESISKHFYWPAMSCDIDKWVAECTACQLTRRVIKEEMQYTPLKVNLHTRMETDPDWAPSLHLDHTDTAVVISRAEIITSKKKKMTTLDQIADPSTSERNWTDETQTHDGGSETATAINVGGVRSPDNPLSGHKIQHLLLDDVEWEAQRAQKERFGTHRFAHSDEAIKLYTGFTTYKHLLAFWHVIEPEVKNMLHFPIKNRRKELAQHEVFMLPALSPIDEFFLFMTHLHGHEVLDLAACFIVENSTAIYIIKSWANFLSCILGSIPLWISKESIKAHLPAEFDCYPNTQVVIDFIELRYQKTEYTTEDLVKGEAIGCTLKGMVAMAPHGCVMFVSDLFSGSLSNKEVFQRSGIIPLLDPDMAIVVDTGLTLKHLVPCQVHQLPFLSQEKERPLKMKRSTARLRVHIDKMFQRVREYELFNSTITSSPTQNLNQLFSVACMMLNYQNTPVGQVG